MVPKDPRIDAYIARSAPFAQPILAHIRDVIHHACPNVRETMKWSFPHFDHQGILCGMAAFKQHCALGFWKGELLKDSGVGRSAAAMGQFGRITSIADLPSRAKLAALVKAAAALNESGVKRPREAKTPRPPLRLPRYFTEALKKNKKALTTFEKLSPSHRREYVEWVTGAKTEATRNKRLATAIEWIAEGKSQNWKYERKQQA